MCKPLIRLICTLLDIFISRKLWMAVVGCLMEYVFFWKVVDWLYTFPDKDHIEAYTKLAMCAMGAQATIVLGFMGLSPGIRAPFFETFLAEKPKTKQSHD